MGKPLRSLAWLAIALAAIVFLVWQVAGDPDTWRNFQDAMAGMNWPLAAAALLVYAVSQAFLGVRWRVLLAVHDIRVSLTQALKLTFLGLFYNNFMPGAVGGDLLKAWYITQHARPGARLEAAVTVFVDRIIGLVGLIMIAAGASFFLRATLADAGTDAERLTTRVLWLVWVSLGVMLIAGTVLLSGRIRARLRWDVLMSRLPLAATLTRIDQAVRFYRGHVAAVAKSLALAILIQGLAVVGVWMLCRALGLTQVAFVQCLVLMPIVWVVSAAIPVPGGLGIIEGGMAYLFSLAIRPDAPEQALGQAAALALSWRLLICVASTPGALVPILGGHVPRRAEMARQVEQSESTVGEQP